MAEFYARRISDPVHNTIGLSRAEVAVIGTRCFQRLRNIKQLGLASLVFPGADYSRLSHSIGVCHITGRILEALRLNCPNFKITEAELQEYRLAGLLHDLGHYPFSHAMQDAIENYCSGGALAGSEGGGPKEFYKHEVLGGALLVNDAELRNVLDTYSIDASKVADIFRRAGPAKLTNLISSDLDADRIDYLLRTAHFSGLPYGAVDLEYLLTQLRLDSMGRICLTRKALRAADHFLLSRYFDYQQVAFHKTVVALELVLKDVMEVLLTNGIFDCTKAGIDTQIANNNWNTFDDAAVWAKIKELAHITDDPMIKLKAQSLLARAPAKLVGQYERLGSEKLYSDFARAGKSLKRLKGDLAKKYNIDESLWYVWSKPGITLTKVGSHVPAKVIAGGSGARDKDRYEQAIRILNSQGDDSVDIMSVDQSLMNILSDNALYVIRLYVLLPPDKLKNYPNIRTEICAACTEELAM